MVKKIYRFRYFIILLATASVLSACSNFQKNQKEYRPSNTNKLSDQDPILRIEPETHTSAIKRIAIDEQERFLVSVSSDKTARIWDAKTGKLLKVLRPTIGSGNEGELYSVAISPRTAEWVAISGFTGRKGGKQSIYIFQRDTGRLVKRIPNLPNVVNDMNFSPDGQQLAVALGKGHGVRLYQKSDWNEIAKDTDYKREHSSYSVHFSSKNQIVSTSYDGYIRLYDHKLSLTNTYKTTAGNQPYLAKFSPDNRFILVSFNDSNSLELLDAYSLKLIRTIYSPNAKPDLNSLSTVTWAYNGNSFYGGGRYSLDGRRMPLLKWHKTDQSKPEIWQVAQTTITDIRSLRDGSVILATAAPELMRLNTQGKIIWKQNPGILDFTWKQDRDNFAISADAQKIDIRYAKVNQLSTTHKQSLWSLNELGLVKEDRFQPPPYPTAKNVQIIGLGTDKLIFNGKNLPLKPNEQSTSAAIGSTSQYFAIGTEWALRLFNAQGKELWQKATPVVWAIRISQNGRWIVAAQGDGTIRWYEKETGIERLAFYLHPDEKRWVAWTPEGFYAATEGAEELIGYHLNQGADQSAEFIQLDQVGNIFNRADLVQKALSAEYHQLAKTALREKAGDISDILLKEGLPPEIRIPAGTNYRIKQREFTLISTLKDQGGGIGKVEYRLNGVTMNSGTARPYDARFPAGQKGLRPSLPLGNGSNKPEQDNRGTARLYPRSPVGQEYFRLARTFTLDNGDHELEIIVYTKGENIESRSEKIRVTVDAPRQRKPSLHVLSIGVSNYQNPSLDLKYPADDAVDFAATLQKQGRGLFKTVETEILVDQQVSLKQIEQAFEYMAKQVQPQDVFVLYLAGHGLVADGRYHFVPPGVIDDNAIRINSFSEEKLGEWLASIESGKRIMVIDSCYAGKAESIMRAIERLGEETNSASALFAAASDKQQAMEGIIDNEQGRGLFTYVLLKGLKGEADMIRDNLIKIRELQTYTSDKVLKLSKEKWGHEQTPSLYLYGTDFPITQVR